MSVHEEVRGPRHPNHYLLSILVPGSQRIITNSMGTEPHTPSLAFVSRLERRVAVLTSFPRLLEFPLISHQHDHDDDDGASASLSFTNAPSQRLQGLQFQDLCSETSEGWLPEQSASARVRTQRLLIVRECGRAFHTQCSSYSFLVCVDKKPRKQ
jgi:hypothetical protein